MHSILSKLCVNIFGKKLDGFDVNISKCICQFFSKVFFFNVKGRGLFLVYITAPKPEIIIKHPTLDNYRDTVYQDEKETCYHSETQFIIEIFYTPKIT